MLSLFAQQDLDLENSTRSQSRIRSLSSCSGQRGVPVSSPQPLSARRHSVDVREGVASSCVSDCAELKNATRELFLLPPVQVSKPLTPEGTGGKIVRRRGFQEKRLEKTPSIGDSSPALIRRATIADGETSLRRRRTVGDRDTSPACVQRTTSSGKLPLRRVKSVEDALSLQRTNESKRPSRRSSLKSKDEINTTKIAALEAFLLSTDMSSKPMAETLDSLTRHVLKHHGTKAFTTAHIAHAEAKLAEESKEKGLEFDLVDAVIKGLGYMAEASGILFSEAVGQILWRNRRAESLREKQRSKDAVDDLSWVADCAEDPDVAGDVLKALDDVFDMFEVSHNGKGINVKAWQRVTKFVEANPVLKRRVKLTDVDRLWHAATHKPPADPQISISRRAFKELLLTWCEAMGVHPWMVFVAVGSHANDADYSDTSQKMIHTANQSKQSNSHAVSIPQ